MVPPFSVESESPCRMGLSATAVASAVGALFVLLGIERIKVLRKGLVPPSLALRVIDT